MPINLPNGNDVEEIVLPNGANASEVYGPNGNLVWDGTAIPDIGLLHDFDAQAIDASDGETVSTVPDTESGVDATGSATFVENGVGGVESLDFDGNGDVFTASVGSISRPFVIYTVVNLTDDGDRTSLLASGNGNNIDARFENSTGDQYFSFWGTTAARDGTVTTDDAILTWIVDGSDSVVRENGSIVAPNSGDPTGGIDDISFGGDSFNDRRYQTGLTSRALIYDRDNAPPESEVEDSLADIYGISIN